MSSRFYSMPSQMSQPNQHQFRQEARYRRKQGKKKKKRKEQESESDVFAEAIRGKDPFQVEIVDYPEQEPGENFVHAPPGSTLVTQEESESIRTQLQIAIDEGALPDGNQRFEVIKGFWFERCRCRHCGEEFTGNGPGEHWCEPINTWWRDELAKRKIPSTNVTCPQCSGEVVIGGDDGIPDECPRCGYAGGEVH